MHIKEPLDVFLQVIEDTLFRVRGRVRGPGKGSELVFFRKAKYNMKDTRKTRKDELRNCTHLEGQLPKPDTLFPQLIQINQPPNRPVPRKPFHAFNHHPNRR
jgi:stalled ribosome alternative rescue factor ArfA